MAKAVIGAISCPAKETSGCAGAGDVQAFHSLKCVGPLILSKCNSFASYLIITEYLTRVLSPDVLSRRLDARMVFKVQGTMGSNRNTRSTSQEQKNLRDVIWA
jgi:hypothetical protein